MDPPNNETQIYRLDSTCRTGDIAQPVSANDKYLLLWRGPIG
jgi:hypothetical protein